MTTFTQLTLTSSDSPGPFTNRLRLAVAAYLARFKGSSREHTESDLRCYLSWCAEQGLDPLAARRPHLELYIRWMQEIRRFKPSTVSRRFSVTAGLYRTCVLEHSPAEYVRRPSVAAESPTLGFTHLQFEALLTAARQSPNRYDFALVAMLGLLGLRIFEATGADIADLGEEHGRTPIAVIACLPRLGCTMSRVYVPVRAQCTRCSRPWTRNPVSSDPATSLAAICSRARSRNPASSPAARAVMPATVPEDSGMPNRSASACAVRSSDRNCPACKYTMAAATRGPYCTGPCAPAGAAALVRCPQPHSRSIS